MEEVVDSLQNDSASVFAETMVETKNAIAAGNYDVALQTVLEKGLEMTVGLVSKIFIAVVVYFILSWIIKKVNNFVARTLEKKQTDVTLSSFLKSLVNIVLKFLLLIIIISILGIETSSFVALFASAGVAIGMALSGTLQNFAGGVMIMFFKPFKVGDYLEVQGIAGTVKEIQIFNTIFTTLDNKQIIVPNGNLSTSIVTNYSKEETRRVDFEFSIAYGDDYDKAKSVLTGMVDADERIITDDADKAPFIALSKLDESSVNIVVRVWVKPADYWPVYFGMNERVYKEFGKQGLSIPFPQMDIHIHQS